MALETGLIAEVVQHSASPPFFDYQPHYRIYIVHSVAQRNCAKLVANPFTYPIKLGHEYFPHLLLYQVTIGLRLSLLAVADPMNVTVFPEKKNLAHERHSSCERMTCSSQFHSGCSQTSLREVEGEYNR